MDILWGGTTSPISTALDSILLFCSLFLGYGAANWELNECQFLHTVPFTDVTFVSQWPRFLLGVVSGCGVIYLLFCVAVRLFCTKEERLELGKARDHGYKRWRPYRTPNGEELPNPHYIKFENMVHRRMADNQKLKSVFRFVFFLLFSLEGFRNCGLLVSATTQGDLQGMGSNLSQHQYGPSSTSTINSELLPEYGPQTGQQQGVPEKEPIHAPLPGDSRIESARNEIKVLPIGKTIPLRETIPGREWTPGRDE